MASYRGTMIYATPSEAKKISTYPYMDIDCNIDRQDAKALRDYYDAGEAHATAAVGLLVGFILGPLGSLGVIAGGTAALATNIAVECWEDRDAYFEDLATNSDGTESWKMKIRYKYKRKGSNDGAWKIQSYTVSEA